MIRAVLDTNTLASGAIASSGSLAELIDAWQDDRFIVIISSAILVELERTLSKPYFTQRLEPATIAAYLGLVQSTASIVAVPPVVPRLATHPEDDLIVATAVSGRAAYLVTGDKKLQQIGSHQGVTIMSPRAFLDLLKAHPGN